MDLDPPTLLNSLADAFAACAARHDWPNEHSLAARELLLQPTAVAGDGWNNDPIQLAMSQAGPFMSGSLELLRSTAVELTVPGPGWAVPVVGRASLESASWSYWLTDPTLSIERRAGRAWTLHMAGWWWQAKDEAEPDQLELWYRRTIEILAGAQHRGLKYGLPTKGSAPWVGERMPGSTAAVEALFPEGGSPYRHLSGFAHGGLHALLYGVQFGEPDAKRRRKASMSLPMRERVAFACGAAFGFLEAANRHLTYVGWLDPEWRGVERQLGRNLLAVIQWADQLPDDD